MSETDIKYPKSLRPLPRVAITNEGDGATTSVLIDGKDWSKWITAVGFEVDAGGHSIVTVSFIAALVGDQGVVNTG